MKKILAWVLCAIMMISLVPAALADGFTITVDSVSCNPGDTDVEVPVYVENNPGFFAIQLQRVFASELTYKSATATTSDLKKTGTAKQPNILIESQVIDEETEEDMDYTADGNILTLKFDVADTVAPGDYTVTFNVLSANNYALQYLTDDITVVAGTVHVNGDPVLSGISVNSHPTKTSYSVGESFDASGLSLTATYSDGSTQTVTEGFNVSGFDSTVAGTKTVTVEYLGAQTTFTVTVSQAYDPSVFNLIVDSVSCDPGDTDVEVAVYVDNNPGFFAIQMEKVFPAELKYTGCDAPDSLIQLTDVYHDEDDTWGDNIVVQSLQQTTSRPKKPTDYTANGDIIYLYFDVPADVIPGDYTVSFNVLSANNYALQYLTDDITVVSGTIHVNGDPVVTALSLGSAPTKTDYFVGEEFDTAGLSLTATYSDHSVHTITEGFTVSGFDPTTAGTQTVTVSFESFSVTFDVTVTEIAATGISINTMPGKTVYSLGDTLDTAGLSIDVNYNNGTTENLTEGFTVSGFDSDTEGTKEITVTYLGFEAGFEVNVYDRPQKVVVDSVECFVGDSVTVNVRVENNPGFTFMVLTPVISDALDALDPYAEGVSRKTDLEVYENYVIESSLSGGNDFAEDSTIFTLTFDIPEDFEVGEYPVSFTFREAVNSADDVLSYLVVGGTVTVKIPELTSISVTSLPDKTEYERFESLETEGMSVTAYYTDGSTVDVTNECTVSGFNSQTPGIKMVLVSFEDQTTSFTVTVKVPVLTGITVSSLPTKTAYERYESLDTEGLSVTASYSDRTTADVTDQCVVGDFDSNYPGQKTISVSFEDQVAYFDVTVLVPVVRSIRFASLPDKTEYRPGEELDMTGAVVEALYSDRTVMNAEGYTVSGFDSSKTGVKTVTVSYEGASASFEVTVKAKLIVEDAACFSGDSVTFTVRTQGNTGFNLITLTPDLGEAFGGIEITSEGIDGVTTASVYSQNVIIESVSGDFDQDGELFTFTIETPEDLPGGQYDIGFIFREGVDSEGADVLFDVEYATLSVTEFIYGDVNGDRTVNLKDVNLIKRYIGNLNYDTGESTVAVCKGADANGDGVINLKDVNLLKRYMAAFDYNTNTSTVALGPQN